MATHKIVKGQIVAIAKSPKLVRETKTLLRDATERAAHTFWQAFTATFIGGLSAVSTFSGLEDLALASGVAALAATFAFTKTYIKAYVIPFAKAQWATATANTKGEE